VLRGGAPPLFRAGGGSPSAAMRVDAWDFDVLKDNPAAPLVEVGTAVFKLHRLPSSLGLPEPKLQAFLKALEAGYLPGNAYHNPLHAADVLAAASYLSSRAQRPLGGSKAGGALKPHELFALFLAAAGHDVGHFARNNGFIVNSSHELCKRFDASPLENMHLERLVEVMEETGVLGACARLDDSQRAEVRSLVQDLVLATDMATHKKHVADLTELRDKAEAAGKGALDVWCSPAGRRATLVMMIKCADLGNVFRALPSSEGWGKRIMEEFYAQAAEERAVGLEVTTYTEPVALATHQLGFAVNVIVPLLELFCGTHLEHDVGKALLAQARANVDKWNVEVEASKEKAMAAAASKEEGLKKDIKALRSTSLKRLKTPNGYLVESPAVQEEAPPAEAAPEQQRPFFRRVMDRLWSMCGGGDQGPKRSRSAKGY